MMLQCGELLSLLLNYVRNQMILRCPFRKGNLSLNSRRCSLLSWKSGDFTPSNC
uniref:Uncharacterized protein n=1 Tax=Arundo donax TaxID=35708 RepID=A0A0A9EA76_ARUDO